MSPGKSFGKIATIGGITLLAGCVSLWIIGCQQTNTRGATRSSKLKWEERERQIEEAAAQEAEFLEEETQRSGS